MGPRTGCADRVHRHSADQPLIALRVHGTRPEGCGMSFSDRDVSRLLFKRRELLSFSGIKWIRTNRPSGTDRQRWRVVLHMAVVTRNRNVTVGETGQIFLSNSRLISDVTSMKRGS
jgi:hypothetical protein